MSQSASRWLPVVAWAAMIWTFSSSSFQGEETGRFLLPLLGFLLPGASAATLELLHGGVRKLAHITEFAIFAALLVRALGVAGRSRRRIVVPALVLGLAWAGIDEIRQTFVPERVGSPVDVGFDGLGVLLGTCLAERFSSGRRSRA